MKPLWKFVSYLVLSVNILVLFFYFFESRMDLPVWVQSFGRMHPLLLHLPIGISILSLLFVAFEKHFEQESFQRLVIFLLNIAALTASLTALMGLILAAEGGYAEETLGRHRNAGVAMSLLSWLTLFIYSNFSERKVLFRSFLMISIICLILTGHLGSVLTHGENFILEPFSSAGAESVEVTDSTSLFKAAVIPVLNRKCVSCHNATKVKGQLDMTSIQKLTKGGEHGVLWKASEPDKSLLLSRLLLPEQHKEHMPPAGKPQLNIHEMQLLYQWILSGADTATAWTKFHPDDSLRRLAETLIRGSAASAARRPTYTFSRASDETIEDLNNPYRTVSPTAINEPALTATFFLRDQFQSSRLEELLEVKEQLVDLNLAKMPVTDEDCSTIRQFFNLEKLNLNFSNISGKGLSTLSSLERLRSLSLAGTALTPADLGALKEFAALEEVFIWNTGVTEKEAGELSAATPTIHWNMGYVPDDKEILRLSPPTLVNESIILKSSDKVRVSHNLPGAVIRYTVDGTEPDTLTGRVFEQPFPIDGFTVLKMRVCKPGWFASNTVRYLLFKEGVKPSKVELVNKPAKEYKGEGSATLVDRKKGEVDNLRGDIAWLGYREQPLIAGFSFDDEPAISVITISFARNIGAFLMPPERVEFWAGADKDHLRLIREIRPAQPAKYEPNTIDVISIPTGKAKFSYCKIIMRPVARLPSWHSGKGQKGWVFVDEIFFN